MTDSVEWAATFRPREEAPYVAIAKVVAAVNRYESGGVDDGQN